MYTVMAACTSHSVVHTAVLASVHAVVCAALGLLVVMYRDMQPHA